MELLWVSHLVELFLHRMVLELDSHHLESLLLIEVDSAHRGFVVVKEEELDCVESGQGVELPKLEESEVCLAIRVD